MRRLLGPRRPLWGVGVGGGRVLGNLLLEEASQGAWLTLYQLGESPLHAAHRAASGPVAVGEGGALYRDAWPRG